MKVNVNQMPDNEPESSRPELKKQSKAFKRPKKEKPVEQMPADDGKFDYGAAIRGYTDKWQAQLKEGAIFRQNKFWIIIGAILCIVFISVNSNMNNAKTYYTVELRRITGETAKLNYNIDKVKADLEEQARIDAIQMTEEQEELAKQNAVEQGTSVAMLQNRYQEYDLDQETNPDGWRKDQDDFGANKNALKLFFQEGSGDGTSEWYLYSDSIPGKWEFVSRAPFRGNTAKVLWLCKGEDGTLLAYCTAKYNADTKLFTDVNHKLTKYAKANVVPSDDYENVDMNSPTSIAEDLKSLVEDGIIEPSDEVLDDQTIKINNGVTDVRQDYKDSVADGEIEGEEFDERYNLGPTNVLPDTDDSSGMMPKSDN